VSPWTLKALASFPPFVNTISASAVGLIAAATSAQPKVTRPWESRLVLSGLHRYITMLLYEPCPRGQRQISMCGAIGSLAPRGS
jgi:hypothetical protein